MRNCLNYVFGLFAVLLLLMPSLPVLAESPWLVRVRGISMQPDETSTVRPIGGAVDAENDIVPELDISYFFNQNIALELILATTRHQMTVNGSTLGNVDLGKVSILPPILTLQYHFAPKRKVRPYIGAGINYTVFYSEDAPGTTVTQISYDDTFGWALQAGVDLGLNDHWALNIDVKRAWINTDVSINNGAITADVDLDPWIFGIGLAYRF